MTTRLDYRSTATDSVAEALTDQLFTGRAILPRGPNGKDPGCKDARADVIRQNVQTNKAKPVHMLLALVKAFAEDGVPHTELLAFARELSTAIEVLCVSDFSRRIDHPLPVLIHMESAKETKLEGQVNMAQRCVDIAPNDPHALESFLRVSTRYEYALQGLTQACSRNLAVVRGQPRAVVGARSSLRIHA